MKKIRRKQIIKCYKLKVESARRWLHEEMLKFDFELRRKMERSTFNLVWHEWFGRDRND